MQDRIPLEEKGFMVVRQLIPLALAEAALADIKHTLTKLAQRLSVPIADYMYCTGRWATDSPVTKCISTLDVFIKHYLEALWQCPVVAKKANVICKTADLIESIPFHQDIAYSFNAPYHFSVWVALNDVRATSGALQVIKGSHQWPVAPLVDFWQPHFVDRKADIYKDQIETLPIATGDAIIFDAKLWHGSAENLEAKDRFSYVTRWVIPAKEFPEIPKPKVSDFGLLNCGFLTEHILRKALPLFVHLTIPQNKTELIYSWLNLLTQPLPISGIDPIQAQQDLYKLLILEQASTLHDAGDSLGKVYKNVWFSLLRFLNQSITVVGN
ncbi:phytanoyl-CoA dioxygenase family protein [Candidatus Cardinium hertigii]|uniref:Phytanoyl-CoA dioxygenase n=1 Tax=Candidatus Cardinium hertigii TaxID=247481 RepID=A0A2Z3LBQ5_9BACT|nr:phytanoyl-CoA dioxygenase family protein [Candidatus Cardinium hertigii]AWN81622.1 hypothetical protein DK880_00290 [Candidatus Cardinium hertigii]